jgi:hypothetical protein
MGIIPRVCLYSIADENELVVPNSPSLRGISIFKTLLWYVQNVGTFLPILAPRDC